MDSTLAWNDLVAALRNELQENGGLIRLLNQQTKALYRYDRDENTRLEDQIRSQIRIAIRCRQSRETILRQTASSLALGEEASSETILAHFPMYVQPLLEALCTEVECLNGRLVERLRQNQQLKEHFLTEITPRS
ncbi:MAG: hypothetical protein JO015_12815 [Verrucomicrobia bacterium]|nr:hypothetical protein [Verrucomicrobiota bacterium]